MTELFGALGDKGGWQASADREVVERFLDTPPPGLDELVAVAALAERGDDPEAPDLLVVDTAPTGHALRLLEMPRVALDWDHALMSILLKYRRALGLGAAAEELLRLAADLHSLDERLHDPARTRFVVVTRAARLPHRETVRLVRALGALGLSVPAVVVNALTAGECPSCRRRAAAEAGWSAELARALAADPGFAAGLGGGAILRAPARFPPPRGAGVLAQWGFRWRVDRLPDGSGASAATAGDDESAAT
jgi:arsenite-transporting ATPase